MHIIFVTILFIVAYLTCFVVYESTPAVECTCVSTSDQVFEELWQCHQEDFPYPVLVECTCPNDPRASPPDEVANYRGRAHTWRLACMNRNKKQKKDEFLYIRFP